MKKLLTLMLAVMMVFSFASVAMAAETTTVNLVYTAASSDPAADAKLEFKVDSETVTSVTINKGDSIAFDVGAALNQIQYKIGGKYEVYEDVIPFATAGEFTINVKYVIIEAVEAKPDNPETPETDPVEAVAEVAVTATLTVKVLDNNTVPNVSVEYYKGGTKVGAKELENLNEIVKYPYSVDEVKVIVKVPTGGSSSGSFVSLPAATGIVAPSVPDAKNETATITATVKAPDSTDHKDAFAVEIYTVAEDKETTSDKIEIKFVRDDASVISTIKKLDGVTPNSESTFIVTADEGTETYAYEFDHSGAYLKEPSADGFVVEAYKDGVKQETTNAKAKDTNSGIKVTGMENGYVYLVKVPVMPEKVGDDVVATNYTVQITCTITTPYLNTLKWGDELTKLSSDKLVEGETEYKETVYGEDDYYVAFTFDSAFTVTAEYNDKPVSVKENSSKTYHYVYLEDIGTRTNIVEDELVLKVKNAAGETETYNIEITALEDSNPDAEIESLSFSTKETSNKNTSYFDFTPDFHPNRLGKNYTYTVRVDDSFYESEYETIYIRLTVDDDYKVTASGATKESQEESKDSRYKDDYVFSVKAPAEDDSTKVILTVTDTDSNKSEVYNFKIVSGEVPEAEIDDIDVYYGSSKSGKLEIYPAFKSDVFEYYLPVAEDDDIDYIYFDVDYDDDDFELEVDGASWNNSSKMYRLKFDANSNSPKTVTFNVENEDGGDEDYVFYVMMGDEDDADEDQLKSLSLRTSTSSKNELKLDKTFAAGTTKYTTTVDKSQSYIYVYASAKDSKAEELLIVNGELKEFGTKISGLKTGANTVEVVCIAENCDDVTVYTITVYRGEGSSELTGLTLYSGSTSIDLSPKFSKTGFAYTTTVANGIKGINIAPTSDAAYVVVKNTATGVSSTIYKSSEAGYLALNEGLNSLTITTVGSDLSVSIYHVAVWRQPAKINPTVSTQNLTVDGKAKTLSTYNISGNNFIKLRDLAALLDGTDKEFAISDTASTKKVTLTSDSSYKSLGTELTKLPTAKQSAATAWTFYLDGTQVKFTAYNIDGANYVMLRDMALFMDFGLTYNNTTRTIAIDTDDNYTPGK